jgi:hypothetical protein
MATKINLRRAAALQTLMHDMLKTIEVKPNIKLNEFQSPDDTLKQAQEQFFAADTRRNDIMMAIYTIRSLVGIQNAVSGVSSKLSHMAYLDKRVSQLTEMLSTVESLLSAEVIAGKLEKIRTRVNDTSRASIYGFNHDEVETGILSPEQISSIQAVVRDLKRTKSQLNDEILELNVRTEIELTPEVETVLTKEGLI